MKHIGYFFFITRHYLQTYKITIEGVRNKMIRIYTYMYMYIYRPIYIYLYSECKGHVEIMKFTKKNMIIPQMFLIYKE